MYFLQTKVQISDMKVNNVDHLSSISFSSTIKGNRNVCAKKNQGFGQQMADGCLRIFTVTSTMDSDILDSGSQKMNK
jgi:hypothetical protein